LPNVAVFAWFLPNSPNLAMPRQCHCGGLIRQHELTGNREAWTCGACKRYGVIERGQQTKERTMSDGTITVRDRPDGGLDVKLIISDDRGKASNLAHSLVLLLAKLSDGAVGKIEPDEMAKL
jgi:hypothetical protein